jgi:hypothetical protein
MAMKTIQAWGWLAAGVVALGVNGFYHDGGLELAHRVMDRVVDQAYERSEAVVALASERADDLLARVEMVSAREQTPASSCRVATSVARFQSHVARGQAEIAGIQRGFDRFQAMSDREAARLEASRARIEAQAAHFRLAAFNPVVVRVPEISCPRVRVVVAQPNIHIAIPDIQVRTGGTGPI